MSVSESESIIKSDTIIESSIPIFNSWDDLDLNPELLRGIYGYGFEKPSPIQSKAIFPIKEGRDLIAQAQSGTGKTATVTDVIKRLQESAKKEINSIFHIC